MSVSDPKFLRINRFEEPAEDQAPVADRSASAPRLQTPPEIERLVGMLSDRGGSDAKISKALDGLARWSAPVERAPEQTAERTPEPLRTPAAARSNDKVSTALEERLAAFARTLTERPRFEPARPVLAAVPKTETPSSTPLSAVRESRIRGEAPAPASASSAVPAPAPKTPPIASLRAALAEIANRQKALDAEFDSVASEAAAVVMASELAAEPNIRRIVTPEMISEIRSQIETLGATVGSLPTRVEIDGLIREIGALSARLASTRSTGLDAESLRAIDLLVGEVERMRGGAATPKMISGFSEELSIISARLDQLGPRNAAAIEALSERIDGIWAELAGFPRIEAVGDIAAEIQKLVARLDAQEREAVPTRKAVEGLTTRVAALDNRIEQIAVNRGDDVARANAIRVEFESLPTKSTMLDLGRQIEALTDGLKVRPQPAPAVTAFKDLSGKVESIDGKLAALAASLATPPAPKALDTLAFTIGGLSDRVESISYDQRTTGSALDRVEEAVRAIADRMSGPIEVDTQIIEAQVSRIVDGLDRHDGRIDDLNAAFSGLAARIEQSYETLGSTAIETASGSEIARALDELRIASALAERRSAEALDTVRGTLERLVDRVERAPAAGPSEDGPRTGLMTPSVDATEAARAAARRALAEAGVGPHIDADATFRPISDLAPNQPIEPGAALRPELAAAQTAASFIAAARRASMQPSADSEGAPAPGKTKPQTSHFSGLFASLKARKRPMLVGVAASLIILGALYAATGMRGVEEEDMTPPSLDDPIVESPAETTNSAAAPVEGKAAPLESPPAPAVPEAAPSPASAPEKRSEAESPAAISKAEEIAIAAPKSVTTSVEVAKPDAINAEIAKAQIAEADAAKSEAAAETAKSEGADALPAPAMPRAKASDLNEFAFGKTKVLPKGKLDWTKAEPESTGSLGPAGRGLPDQIGGATLRLRAVSGDPAAQLEVADRLLSGRNVPADPAAAAVWLEKAASQGLAPAQHRLGSLYEKGNGVARDLPVARQWYERAAASGNVRAMHNLGVLHAEGGLGKPDYDAAAIWFRMAAERGLVDSEYNLGVLNARGLGGKRNLIDAYKWFSLAAAQGDEDAGRKRDEVAKALGQNLDMAKAIVEAFRPRPVDSAANDAPSPPGGWDVATNR